MSAEQNVRPAQQEATTYHVLFHRKNGRSVEQQCYIAADSFGLAESLFQEMFRDAECWEIGIPD